MDKELDSKIDPNAVPFYVFGPMTTEKRYLVPRKWWQFWLPRLVEVSERTDYFPSSGTGTRKE